jgi:hypothetical protein
MNLIHDIRILEGLLDIREPIQARYTIRNKGLDNDWRLIEWKDDHRLSGTLESLRPSFLTSVISFLQIRLPSGPSTTTLLRIYISSLGIP